MVFGVWLFLMCWPTVSCLTNVNDAAESNRAVSVLLYCVQQGLSLWLLLIVLNATILCPPGADRHLGRHSLLAKEPPMVLHRVALRLCPTRGVPHVALLWPFLHLNPWVQQYPSGSYKASSSHPFVVRGVVDLVVGKVASTIFKRR